MQRWAFSETGEQVFADVAVSQVDYVCPECFSAVRVRRGEERIPHFFHTKMLRTCRLHRRERAHLAVQDWLVRKLGEQNCTKECFFSEIQRVADVAYHPKKVVFEVQVSPIDEKVARERTESYYEIGWHVIWLLHVERFGKTSTVPFERLLYSVPHYFTNIHAQGGKLWDEESAAVGSRRRWYVWPLSRRYFPSVTIDVTRLPPKKIASIKPARNHVQWYLDRKKLWSCHIEGDFLSRGVFQEKKRNLSLFRHYPQRITTYLRLAWLRFIGETS